MPAHSVSSEMMVHLVYRLFFFHLRMSLAPSLLFSARLSFFFLPSISLSILSPRDSIIRIRKDKNPSKRRSVKESKIFLTVSSCFKLLSAIRLLREK